MDNQRYDKLLRYIASILAKWRFEEDLSIEEVAESLHMGKERARAALLAEDWAAKMKDIAIIEDTLGKDIFTVPRNKNFKQ